jgi:hypothetical protein
MSGKTYTGSIEILVQAIENPGAPERIFKYSGTDSFLMTIVGDQVVMLFERFPENIQGGLRRQEQAHGNQIHITMLRPSEY